MPINLLPNIDDTKAKQPLTETGSNDKPVEVDGIHYNSRGYEICGQMNQHSKPCQRIGTCPFHKRLATTGAPLPPPVIPVPPVEKEIIASPVIPKSKPDPPIKKKPYKRGWTKDEHLLFLSGHQIHGKGAWKEISMIVRTRTPTQIQSHAQKYFLRQKQEVKNKRSIHDISLEDFTELPDSSRQISSKSPTIMQRPQVGYGYPLLSQQYQSQDLNMILGTPMGVGLNGMPAPFPLSYAPWLPQIYPFPIPINIHPGTIGFDGSISRIDISDAEREELSKAGEDQSDKRQFDAFPCFGYPSLSMDDKTTKILKQSDTDFLF